MTRVLAAAAALVLAGCVSTQQWDRPETTRESAEADTRACSALAESYPAAPARRTTQISVTDRDAERQLVEAQRVEACMKQKGYRLKTG